MELVLNIAGKAAAELKERWTPFQDPSDLFTRDHYAKFLSLHYHLVHGAARHMMLIASHDDLIHRPRLRGFLIDYALQHEHDHILAASDLRNLGCKPLPAILDVKLWWSYFNAIVDQRPFIRLGAAFTFDQVLLEASPVLDCIQDYAKFITPRTAQYISFLVSEEYAVRTRNLWQALQTSHLNVSQIGDLQQGAAEGGTLYQRMSQWIFEKSSYQLSIQAA